MKPQIIMKNSILLLASWLYLFPWEVLASPMTHLKRGDQTAQDFLNQLEAKKKEAGPHPFSLGPSKEANISVNELQGRTQLFSQKDPAAQMVLKSSESRPQVKIDPQKDPLITGSQKAVNDPLTTIGGEGTRATQTKQAGIDATLTCEEPGDDVDHTCHSRLIVTLKEERGPLQQGHVVFNGPGLYHSHIHQGLFSMPRVKSRHFVAHIRNISHLLKTLVSQKTKIPVSDIQSVSASNNGGWIKVGHKRYSFASYTVRYSYTPKIKTPVFSWTNECEALENKVDQGLCFYGSKVCTQGRQTRLIEDVSVTQDCWEYTFTYHCSYPAKDDCGPLRAKGCAQIHSTCKQKVGNACVVYTQTYQCKGSSQTIYSITGGNTPFCLDGNCRDQSYELNDEMMSSVAQLSLLKDMQGKMNSIFKGDQHQCSKYILNFKDCCGSGNGWGKSIGLGGCGANEKLLQKKRQARLCHYVGTYCAKKVLGKCIKKKSSYCCFGSKLLKAFQEQGRAQIHLGWGEPKHPLCRGFTIEEIQRIDFSKLDLREAFEDLMKNYNPAKLQGTSQKIGERLDTIKHGLSPSGLSPTGLVPHTKQQPKQRPEA